MRGLAPTTCCVAEVTERVVEGPAVQRGRGGAATVVSLPFLGGGETGHFIKRVFRLRSAVSTDSRAVLLGRLAIAV